MKNFFIGFGLVVLITVLYVGCSIVGGTFNAVSWFAGRSIDVAKQQLDPAELLRKYELFKDQSAQLDAKLASIKAQQELIKTLGVSRDRLDREQLLTVKQELVGMKASFNLLAADYNAQMSKINYAFCNVGQLPQGASTPLPREYKPYIEE